MGDPEPAGVGGDAVGTSGAGTGVPSAGAAGHGGTTAVGDGALCVANASIEGTAFLGDPANWKSCKGTPDVSPAIAQLPANDGATYLAMFASESDVIAESTQATLCAPLAAGKPVALELDLTMSAIFGPFGSAALQIWGARTACAPETLLWSSPVVTQFDAWRTYCAILSPPENYPYLVLVPTPQTAGANGYLLLDNLRPAETCR